MSDAPTRPYPEPDDDSPTERFDTATEPQPAAPQAPPPDPPDRSTRGLLIALIALGAALLIALIVLLVVLLGDNDDAAPLPSFTPTTSSTPSETPSATPTTGTEPEPEPSATQEPPPPPEPISSFAASAEVVDCSGGGPVPVTFSWSATGQTLWFGIGTENAKNSPYAEYPLNYTTQIDYQCGQSGGQQLYTITVESAQGDITSDTIVIREE